MALFIIVYFVLIDFLATTVIYNLFFHPLANVPGPFLARISVPPSFYHACKGDRHIWICRMFQQYGDTFRAAPSLALTEQSFKAAAPMMASHIDQWIELLARDTDDGWSIPRNMATWVDHLVFDVLGDLCFEEAFNTKEP